MKKSLLTEKSNIVFFDGVCNLCNEWVDFLIARDRHSVLKFASLQGESAKSYLPAAYIEDIHTIVFLHNGQLYFKSSAVLRAIAHLGGLWKLFLIFLVIPVPLRNIAYRLVAKYRYRWFGKRETCRLPTPEEKARFLP